MPGRGALPPPLRGPVSAERPRRAIGRGAERPAGLDTGDAGRGRVPSALPQQRGCGRRGPPRSLSLPSAAAAVRRVAPRGARDRASSLDGLSSSNAPRRVPAAGRPRLGRSPVRVRALGGPLRRRRTGECGRPRAERRRRRSASVPPPGDGRPEGACRRRRRSRPGPCPSLPRCPSPAACGPKAGLRGGRGGASPPSPRVETRGVGGAPRLSAAGLPPGVGPRKGTRRCEAAAAVPGVRPRWRRVSLTGRPRVLATPARDSAASASGAGGGARLPDARFPAGSGPRAGARRRSGSRRVASRAL